MTQKAMMRNAIVSPKRNYFTDAERADILAQHAAGVAARVIGAKYGRTASSIYNVVDRANPGAKPTRLHDVATFIAAADASTPIVMPRKLNNADVAILLPAMREMLAREPMTITALAARLGVAHDRIQWFASRYDIKAQRGMSIEALAARMPKILASANLGTIENSRRAAEKRAERAPQIIELRRQKTRMQVIADRLGINRKHVLRILREHGGIELQNMVVQPPRIAKPLMVKVAPKPEALEPEAAQYTTPKRYYEANAIITVDDAATADASLARRMDRARDLIRKKEDVWMVVQKTKLPAREVYRLAGEMRRNAA